MDKIKKKFWFRKSVVGKKREKWAESKVFINYYAYLIKKGLISSIGANLKSRLKNVMYSEMSSDHFKNSESVFHIIN